MGLGGGFNLHEDGPLGGCIQNTAAWKQLVAPHPGHLSVGSVRPLLSLTQGPRLSRVFFSFPYSSTLNKLVQRPF